jgi:ABC-type dipeptide/oligopeptide/nickel transport system ATPase component
MCRPHFIIADEPTAGLDEELRAGLLALITRLRDTEGLGILMISHDMHAVATISDEVVVMDNGRRV